MSIRLFMRKMSQTLFKKVASNAEIAENRLNDLKIKVEHVRKVKVEEKIKQLIRENEALAAKVELALNELIRLETCNGKKQYPISNTVSFSNVIDSPVNSQNEIKEQPSLNVEREHIDPMKKNKKKTGNATPVSDSVNDVRKLDFRVGKIVEISKHPDADTLYVEKIDCGEQTPRTVVSGLVNHVPINEMKDRIVIVLCNLKPVKMRGITSEAMVMCASSPEKVEVLIPPSGAIPGDLVVCENYPREPEAQLNPKKKIFEMCSPDLRTNEDKIACYKGSPLIVPSKGPVVAATLKGVLVK